MAPARLFVGSVKRSRTVVSSLFFIQFSVDLLFIRIFWMQSVSECSPTINNTVSVKYCGSSVSFSGDGPFLLL